MSKRDNHGAEWTFLTNHSHVLLCLARDNSMRMRDIAEVVGITERAVQRIVADLEEAGYIEHERVGRRNTYRVHGDLHLRHPVERHCRISELIEMTRGGAAGEDAAGDVRGAKGRRR